MRPWKGWGYFLHILQHPSNSWALPHPSPQCLNLYLSLSATENTGHRGYAVPHHPEMGFILSQETARLVVVREPHSCQYSTPVFEGG